MENSKASLTANRHDVTIVVRSEEKGEKVLARYPAAFHSQLSVSIVPDFTKENAFDTCIKTNSPLDAVIHVASPYHFLVSDIQSELLDPSIKGTEALLQAIKEYVPMVKKVVS